MTNFHTFTEFNKGFLAGGGNRRILVTFGS